MSDKKQTINKKKIPTKKTLNLMVKVKTLASPTRLIPILLLIVVGALLFSKFAVIDRLNKVEKEEAELRQMKNQLEMIQNAFVDYDQVEEEYNRYSYANFDQTIPDRLDVLDLMERIVFPRCAVESIAMNGRTLQLTLNGLTLEETSSLMSVLMMDMMVEDVDVLSYVDNTDDVRYAYNTKVVTMVVTLADASTTYSAQEVEDYVMSTVPEDEIPEEDIPAVQPDDIPVEENPADEPVGDGTWMDNNTADAADDFAEPQAEPDGTENGGVE